MQIERPWNHDHDTEILRDELLYALEQARKILEPEGILVFPTQDDHGIGVAAAGREFSLRLVEHE